MRGFKIFCCAWQVIKAKENVLNDMLMEVAGYEEGQLKRLLGEDEKVQKRREDVTRRLKLLKKANEEITLSGVS